MARDRARNGPGVGRTQLTRRPPAAVATLVACTWLAVAGCAASPRLALPDEQRVGVASYYDRGFAGHLTASGERYDPRRFTAAHRTLAFGTRVRVTNLANGRRVVVRINDRGPERADRLIDLSRRAARRLGMLGEGVTRVRLDILAR
jgi:rare lipoprotein A